MEPNYLLMGTIYCMEGARSFLREAVLLYTRGSYPASCVLGTIAAEHLGQCQWLLSKWTAIKNGALMLNCNRLEKDLERDHEGMLRDGFVAVQYGVPKSLSFEILTALDEGTPEYAQAAEGLEKAHKKIRSRFPRKFLDLRIRAQYVKPSDACRRWSRPSQVSAAEAHDLLLNVGNSYRTTLYLQLAKKQEIVATMHELGLKETLMDVTYTWPPPEGDLEKPAQP